MTKTKIAGYLRISVDIERDTENTSIENQREIIEHYVAEHFPECELVFFTDRDRSGYTFTQRDGYQQMRSAMLDGEFRILVLKDLSRFSRRNGAGLAELEYLRDAGVRIISISEGVDYPTADDWMRIQVYFLFNELPVTDASKKVKKVIESRQKDGKWICGVPYGYRLTNTKLMTVEVDEASAAVVAEIYEKYNAGWGYKKIANHLTQMHCPTPRAVEKDYLESDGTATRIAVANGGVWAIPTVRAILMNDFYIGTLRQKKYTRTKINGKDKKLAESENLVFENHHKAIISPTAFARAKENMEMRTSTDYRGIKKYDNTYSGLLYCGDCGAKMFSMSRSDIAPAYRCSTYHRMGKKGCSSHHVREDLLDRLVKGYIAKIKDNSASMLSELQKAVKASEVPEKKRISAFSQLEKDYTAAKERYKATLSQKVRQLAAHPENEDIIEEAFSALEKEGIEKIKGIESGMKLLADRQHLEIQAVQSAKTVFEIFDDILEKPKLEKSDLAVVVDRISVYADRIDITLKPDITELLRLSAKEDGTDEKEISPEELINFESDTAGIVQQKITLSTRNRADKAYCVNVIYKGDPLEIFTDRDGEVIFKKYSPIGELLSFASQYADTLCKTCSYPIIITDRDSVVAFAGLPKKECADKKVSSDIEEIMESRQLYTRRDGEKAHFPIDGNEKYEISAAMPIISEGDLIGSVMSILPEGTNSFPDDVEVKLIQTAAVFLGKQLEA